MTNKEQSKGNKVISNRLNDNEFVTLHNLTKNYGIFRALDSISLGIKEGEIFGYIGPNGAGKTTTMKILVGLITEFQGEVSIGDLQVPKRKDEIHRLRLSAPERCLPRMAHRKPSA